MYVVDSASRVVNTRSVRRALVILMATVTLVALLPSSAAALPTQPPVDVVVLNANYLDLDRDGMSDDVLSRFSVSVSSSVVFTTSYLYCFLEKPSGETHLYIIKVIGSYSKITIDLGWFDGANEKGWYWFYVYAEVIDRGYSRWDYDQLNFDPPTEGRPAPPRVDVLTWYVQ
ncbi:MAG: hypothetical protein HXY34_05940 [Candidatus Thorarchaeota archaeon]|nr:hypothetical protein [Candidatus Thorarchaeota archaeon]